MENIKHKATCCCGQLNLTYTGEIKKLSICHCFECQKRTGSVFGVQTRFEKNKTLIQGKSSVFQRKGDSDNDVIRFHFCPICGSTLYWEANWLAESYAVAVGTLCDPTLPSPVMQVYVNRKHHWLTLPDSVKEFYD